tara:strand:- start:1213 stop:1569 length:357 start_codon:yes stop_codon:yes gene_type:complete
MQQDNINITLLCIESKKINIVTLPNCPGCEKVKSIFKELEIFEHCNLIKLNEIDEDDYDALVNELEKITNTRKCPMVFIGNEYIGNDNRIEDMYIVGSLKKTLLEKLELDIKEKEEEF